MEGHNEQRSHYINLANDIKRPRKQAAIKLQGPFKCCRESMHQTVADYITRSSMNLGAGARNEDMQ